MVYTKQHHFITSDNNVNSESCVAFYIKILLFHDLDTFHRNGISNHFKKAQTTCNMKKIAALKYIYSVYNFIIISDNPLHNLVQAAVEG